MIYLALFGLLLGLSCGKYIATQGLFVTFCEISTIFNNIRNFIGTKHILLYYSSSTTPSTSAIKNAKAN